MSNIFEIDGEIEDNMDDNGEGKNRSNEHEKQENEPVDNSTDENDSAEIIDDGAEDTGSNSNEDLSQEPEDEEPWYNKYLPEEEREHPHSHHNSEPTEDTDADEDSLNEELSIADQDDNNAWSEPDETPERDEETEQLPAVEDVTDDEIEEVLAELETLEEEEEGFDEEEAEDEAELTEQEITNPEATLKPNKREETFDDIFPKKKNKSGFTSATWVFFILFVASSGLLLYYQVFRGNKVNSGVDKIDSLSTAYQEQLAKLENQEKLIEQLHEKIQKLNERNHELSNDSSKTEKVPVLTGEAGGSAVNINEGTYYQVQLIALQDYHPNLSTSDFGFYIDKENGYSKMLIGALTNEAEAKQLYEKVRKSGFSDAFIVKKVNGQRVTYNPFE
ncbi:hypothetical protein GC194_15280 [bacterium]|nr:hypothetical protein [bacterium]